MRIGSRQARGTDDRTHRERNGAARRVGPARFRRWFAIAGPLHTRRVQRAARNLERSREPGCSGRLGAGVRRMEHGRRDAAAALRTCGGGAERQNLGTRRLSARAAPVQPRPGLRSRDEPLVAGPRSAPADPPHARRRHRWQALRAGRRDRRRKHRQAGGLRGQRLDARPGGRRLGGARRCRRHAAAAARP